MFSKTVQQSRLFSSVLGRPVIALFAALALSGCLGSDNLTATPAFASGADASTKVVTVAGQKVVLGQGSGYCFNEKQSRLAPSGAFVVMAPCDASDEGSTAKGLILVNVLAEEGIQTAIEARDLEAYFQSAEGRAALSRKGNPSSLTVLGTMVEDGIYYVHTRDEDGPVIPDTTADQWRMFLVAADRLVSVTVVNFLDDQMPDGLVFAHMEEIARRIQSLN